MSPIRSPHGSRNTPGPLKPGSTDGGISPQGRRRRRIALLLLLLLLLLGGFWIGRLTAPVPAPAPAEIPAPALPPIPAAATTPSVAASTAPPAASITIAVAAAVTAPSASTAASTLPATRLLEVRVGTTRLGGLTLRFDHPVSWVLQDPPDSRQAELDVQGVNALAAFPRNLPLPPGLAALHAQQVAPDILKLQFDLRRRIRAYASPAAGPAAALTIYFRTPAEANLPAPAPANADMTAGRCGAAATPQVTKAITLLQQSLDKNPGYADVRAGLALLEACSGDGAKAQQLLSTGVKSVTAVRLAVTDATLRYVRGDADGALKTLKANTPPGSSDPGYMELTADLLAASSNQP